MIVEKKTGNYALQPQFYMEPKPQCCVWPQSYMQPKPQCCEENCCPTKENLNRILLKTKNLKGKILFSEVNDRNKVKVFYD